MTIGVLGLFHPRRLMLRAASIQVRSQRLAGELELAALGGQVRVSGADAEVVMAAGDVTLTVPGKWKRTYREAKCRIHSRDGELVAVIEVPVERAVAAVVAAEMPDAPVEAAKAQAVAARSYYTALAPRHEHFDFCDTTHCQLFQEAPARDDAAAATRGLILRHHQHHFGAMYFRSCAGRTKTAAQVRLNPSPYPYFAVECPACARGPFRWRARVTREEAAGLPSENARLELARKYGWNTIASNSFTAVAEGENVLLKGAGHGHGVGMCQRGAVDMAKAGYGFRAILAHYYPETELAAVEL